MPQVQDVLQDRRLFYAETGQTVAQVARRMAELRVGAILVLSYQRLAGIFSERDLMTRVVVEGRDPETTPVEAVMTTGLATIEAHASVEEALEQMQSHNCRHLPVMRGDEVVGFLSMRDLMHHELASKTEELHQMRAYIAGSV